MTSYFNTTTQILYIDPTPEIEETLLADTNVIAINETEQDEKKRALAVYPLSSYRGTIPSFFCTSNGALLQGAYDLEHASNADLIRVKHQIKSFEDVADEIC